MEGSLKMLLEGGKSMFEKSFVQMCLNGELSLFDLDEYIEYWHMNDIGVSLQEYLGLTDYEYEMWGRSSDLIFRDILYCRQNGIDFKSYHSLSDNERIAARSFDQDGIDKLKQQIEDEENE